MAFLLILDREHKALWVKNKKNPEDRDWLLPQVEDPVNKPCNRLNVELLAKQAFIPLNASLLGKKNILDIYHNDQLLYLFLCPGKEASQILFDLTKYRDIQWMPIHCMREAVDLSGFSVQSILKAYHDILLNGFSTNQHHFHVVKNGNHKAEVEDYNQLLLQGKRKTLIQLEDQYRLSHQSVPQKGDYALLNDWKGIPLAVLQMTEVTISPFKDLGNLVEKIEGEKGIPACDLEKHYAKIFRQWCKNHHHPFSEKKQVVLAQFDILRKFREKKMDYFKIS